MQGRLLHDTPIVSAEPSPILMHSLFPLYLYKYCNCSIEILGMKRMSNALNLLYFFEGSKVVQQ